MKTAPLLTIFAFMAILVAPLKAGTLVTVTANGEVEFNQIGAPPLGQVFPGESVTMTFVVDSDSFDDSASFPTRGYIIDQATFSLAFDSATLFLQDPFPAAETPYFVIRDNDPAVDGFFVATNVDFPFGFGVPLNQTGFFGQFQNSYNVTYTGDTLPSLDILDALGTYDFTGLTVFGWTIDDGPFNAMGIVFNQMTIEAVIADTDGDGILDPDDLCADTTIPESVPSVRLGVNRWALINGDGIFDTTAPPGAGPGFEFDLQDTAGCSCEQIIDELGLGHGHRRFGCSNSAMMEWASYATGAGYAPSALDQPETLMQQDRLVTDQ
jgi:hypothetical protein